MWGSWDRTSDTGFILGDWQLRGPLIPLETHRPFSVICILQTSRTQHCIHFSSSADNRFKGKSTTESRVWWHTWAVPALGGHLHLHTKFKDSLVSTKAMCVEASEQQAASLCLVQSFWIPEENSGVGGEPVLRSCKRGWCGICESHGQASWKSSVKFQRFAPYQHS